MCSDDAGGNAAAAQQLRHDLRLTFFGQFLARLLVMVSIVGRWNLLPLLFVVISRLLVGAASASAIVATVIASIAATIVTAETATVIDIAYSVIQKFACSKTEELSRYRYPPR